MSAALTVHPDLSSSQHELSLGSFASFSSIPGRLALRVPSTSSRTTAQSSAPLSTPSPPSASAYRRKGVDAATSLSSRLNMLNDEGDDGLGDGDVLDTPGAEKKRWPDAPETPGAVSRSKRTKGDGKGAPLTLRDQEKVRLCL